MMQGFHLRLNNDLAGQGVTCFFHLQPEDLTCCGNEGAISLVL
jgi:hypothetical protein